MQGNKTFPSLITHVNNKSQLITFTDPWEENAFGDGGEGEGLIICCLL